MRNRFLQMRLFTSPLSIVQRLFRMCHEHISMTLFAMLYRLLRLHDSISYKASFLPRDQIQELVLDYVKGSSNRSQPSEEPLIDCAKFVIKLLEKGRFP